MKTKNQTKQYNKTKPSILIAILLLIPTVISACAGTIINPEPFSGDRAYRDLVHQVYLGPRTVGSEAHRQAVDWIVSSLQKAGWATEVQETTMNGQPVRNVIAKWGEGRPWVVIGAHYDSRLWADRDQNPQNHSKPVPGANDGASGVAVLLELARVLPGYVLKSPENVQAKQIWLVFFDAEDNGEIPGWDWILGSRAFVQSLTDKPDSAVIIDMIGDVNLNIRQEGNSSPQLVKEIWELADSLGYAQQIIPRPGLTILDDHIPFIEAGIPAVDLIDFDYHYYHTVNDTPDKVSPRSLQIIGEVLLAWLTNSR